MNRAKVRLASFAGLALAIGLLHTEAALLARAQSLAVAQKRLQGWVRPYPFHPSYWEFVSEVGLPSGTESMFAGPQIWAVADVAERVSTGELIATVIFFTLSIDENALPAAVEPFTAKELRFVGSDASGVSLALREGRLRERKDCTSRNRLRFAQRTDVRLAFTQACYYPPDWGDWKPLRFQLNGSYVIPGDGFGAVRDGGLRVEFSLRPGEAELRAKVSAGP